MTNPKIEEIIFKTIFKKNLDEMPHVHENDFKEIAEETIFACEEIFEHMAKRGLKSIEFFTEQNQ